MKRIVFCFDGTWNRLSADTPTNVVLTAASIYRESPKGIVQIIHYDEGVGTGRLEKFSGGMFGQGLVQNIREAYRFLILNYDPGDELFVFGFSRGAFSARTFIGLVRHVGVLRRKDVARIDEAMAHYSARLKGRGGDGEAMCRFRAEYASSVCVRDSDKAWRQKNAPDCADAPPLRFKYLGVWDTVGAMGVPQVTPGSKFWNREHDFHDVELSDFVEFGRHAVAIDERRKLFPVTLWTGVAALNEARGFAPDALNAPYQERWFAGTHGGVGGGGDIRGLSDSALAWVIKGAKAAGLEMDLDPGSRINAINPDWRAPIDNMTAAKKGLMDRLVGDRSGPEHFWQVSPCARRRWRAKDLPGGEYRPGALKAVEAALKAEADTQPDDIGEVEIMAHHDVVAGDNLSKLAKKHYGDASLYMHIYNANRDVLDHWDDIYVGDRLRIPAPPPKAA